MCGRLQNCGNFFAPPHRSNLRAGTGCHVHICTCYQCLYVQYINDINVITNRWRMTACRPIQNNECKPRQLTLQVWSSTKPFGCTSLHCWLWNLFPWPFNQSLLQPFATPVLEQMQARCGRVHFAHIGRRDLCGESSSFESSVSTVCSGSCNGINIMGDPLIHDA